MAIESDLCLMRTHFLYTFGFIARSSRGQLYGVFTAFLCPSFYGTPFPKTRLFYERASRQFDPQMENSSCRLLEKKVRE